MLDLLDPTLLHPLLSLSELNDGSKPAPEPEEVKAGGVALLIWLGMAVAVALLCWSLVRELRKTNRARAAGVFGDEPTTTDDSVVDDPSIKDRRDSK